MANPGGNPVDLAQRALDVLSKHAPEVAAWFADGLHSYIQHNGADFAEALGLTARARNAWILEQRNIYIVKAQQICPGEVTKKAEALAQAIANFDWPSVHGLDGPPADWPELQQLIFMIYRASRGKPMPDDRQIAAIAKRYEMNSAIDFVTRELRACKAATISSGDEKMVRADESGGETNGSS